MRHSAHQLALFQSQLVRTVPHMAGLHPRAFRTVTPQLTSRPLSKGILDGALLHTAESMPRAKLLSLVRDLSPRSTGGIHADDLLRCLVHLQYIGSTHKPYIIEVIFSG